MRSYRTGSPGHHVAASGRDAATWVFRDQSTYALRLSAVGTAFGDFTANHIESSVKIEEFGGRPRVGCCARVFKHVLGLFVYAQFSRLGSGEQGLNRLKRRNFLAVLG